MFRGNAAVRMDEYELDYGCFFVSYAFSDICFVA